MGKSILVTAYFGIDLLLKLKYDTYLMSLKQYHSKLTMSLMSFFTDAHANLRCVFFFQIFAQTKKVSVQHSEVDI